MVLTFGRRIGIPMDNKEKIDPEILKEMGEMTNIQNVVHNINMDMVVANEIVMDLSKRMNGRDYSGVKVDIDDSNLAGGKLTHSVHQPTLADLCVSNDDGGYLLDPEKCEIKFSPELGMSTIVPKRTKAEEVLDDMAKHLGPQDMGTLGEKKLVLNEDGVLTVAPMERKPKRPLVVNLFAGPGAGKSTGAAFLFGFLKLHKVNVELVTEFAKELAWEGDKEFMANNQVYITGQQIRRMNRLVGKVDVIITDSPIELGSLYTEDDTLKQLCLSEGRKWDRRLDFFVERVKPYNPSGRNQTLEEAQKLDQQIRDTVPNMLSVTGDMEGYFHALSTILGALGIDIKTAPTQMYVNYACYADQMFNYYKQKDKQCS